MERMCLALRSVLPLVTGSAAYRSQCSLFRPGDHGESLWQNHVLTWKEVLAQPNAGSSFLVSRQADRNILQGKRKKKKKNQPKIMKSSREEPRSY
jgi:hypothetical protein